MRTHLDFERLEGYPAWRVVGVDEVGRGCIAGPVVAGAVLLPPQESAFDLSLFPWLAEVGDSKLLTPLARTQLEPLLQQWLSQMGGAYALGQASVEEIDSVNILQATDLAMARAVRGLPTSAGPRALLIDGNRVPAALRVFRVRPVVKGDLQCFSIAAASILAKVARDRWMTELSQTYPDYGLAVHKGYGTAKHLAALRTRGVTPIHRKSFAPVRACLPSS